jgi:hypothetical protein
MTTIDDQLRRLAGMADEAARKTGVDAVAAWTAYAEATRQAVNQVRALEVADLMFLDGKVLREIADRVYELIERPLSRQAVWEWLARHGPAEYATVAKTGNLYELLWVPVTGTMQTRRDLKRLQDAGRRIAPARWQITRDSQISNRWLWDRIGDRQRGS